MKASRIILVLVALLAGGLAAFLALNNSGSTTRVVEAPPKVIEEKKTQILVAKTPIGVGQRLGAGTVEWQDWPELAVRPEYISKQTVPDALDTMREAVARFEFFPGEPIMERKLVRTSQGYMSAVLPKGMRAVSVEVSANAAAGGFVMPNDRVDIVLTRSATSGRISETLLSNVKVLAIDTRLGEVSPAVPEGDSEKESAEPDPSRNVFTSSAIATFELTPEQGETVINASSVGKLTLVLRSIADYAQTTEEIAQNDTNKAIRIIRAGSSQDVMPNNVAAAAGDGTDGQDPSLDEGTGY